MQGLSRRGGQLTVPARGWPASSESALPGMLRERERERERERWESEREARASKMSRAKERKGSFVTRRALHTPGYIQISMYMILCTRRRSAHPARVSPSTLRTVSIDALLEQAGPPSFLSSSRPDSSPTLLVWEGELGGVDC
jgi:hypothetical protein